MKFNFLCALILLVFPVGTSAASFTEEFSVRKPIIDSTIITKYVDSLYNYSDKLNKGVIPTSEDANSTFYRLFVPLTFYHSAVGNEISLSSDGKSNEVDAALINLYLIGMISFSFKSITPYFFAHGS